MSALSEKNKISWGQKPEAIFMKFITGNDRWKILSTGSNQVFAGTHYQEMGVGANQKVAL